MSSSLGPRYQARTRLTVQCSGAMGSRLRRQLAGCLTACADRSPRGLLVHLWSSGPQITELAAVLGEQVEERADPVFFLGGVPE